MALFNPQPSKKQNSYLSKLYFFYLKQKRKSVTPMPYKSAPSITVKNQRDCRLHTMGKALQHAFRNSHGCVSVISFPKVGKLAYKVGGFKTACTHPFMSCSLSSLCPHFSPLPSAVSCMQQPPFTFTAGVHV